MIFKNKVLRIIVALLSLILGIIGLLIAASFMIEFHIGFIGVIIAVIAGTTLLFAMWPETFSRITQEIGLGHTQAPGSALSGGLLGQKIAEAANQEHQRPYNSVQSLDP